MGNQVYFYLQFSEKENASLIDFDLPIYKNENEKKSVEPKHSAM